MASSIKALKDRVKRHVILFGEHETKSLVGIIKYIEDCQEYRRNVRKTLARWSAAKRIEPEVEDLLSIARCSVKSIDVCIAGAIVDAANRMRCMLMEFDQKVMRIRLGIATDDEKQDVIRVVSNGDVEALRVPLMPK